VDGGLLRAFWEGEEVGSIPVQALAEAPRYALEPERPPELADELAGGWRVDDPAQLLLDLLGSPNVCSKRWVFEQYDQLVGSGTILRPGGDAAVVRLTPSRRAIAIALDGDGARVALDPRRGGREAVAQAVVNVACTGAGPAAITNCLNFGNPERPGTAYMLREAITGMAEACEALETPVVSGNVSLYNEHSGRPIHPTPVVGCVGVLERAACAVAATPTGGGETVFLLGAASPSRDGSEWQALEDGACSGRIPDVDLGAVDAICQLLVEAAHESVLASAHDASDGGLAVALAEICLGASAGCDVRLPDLAGSGVVTLFGESCGNVVVCCDDADCERLLGLCARHDVTVERIGTLGGDRIALAAGDVELAVQLIAARHAYEGTLPRAMEGAA
jgi:phosphoribosylformylglycinamidine synthase